MKDQQEQKVSVMVLTYLFEFEGIDAGMGHLHHGDKNVYGPV